MHMRRFLVVGHRANTNGDFRLDDLPGTGGRMDIIAMSVSSALFLSHGLRKDVEVWLVLLGGVPRTVKIIGPEARYLFPDERNIAGMIRTNLLRYREGKRGTPGIYVSDMDFREAVESASADSVLFYLEEDGENIRFAEIRENSTFILGDSTDLTPEEEEIVEKIGARRISLGRKSLHTYQAIAITNYELDRREESGTGGP